MAITRRQFVTRLGTLAAAMGMSQLDLAKVSEAFAHGSVWAGQPWTTKPKVVWVHGAECTGCSVSLLSLFENATGKAIEGTSVTTLAALDLAVGGTGDGAKVTTASAGHPYGHRTISNTAAVAGSDFNGAKNGTGLIVDIADVLIDFIDLQYHETVMGMGSDLAYQWLKDNMDNGDAGAAFVLVVEGAIQPKGAGGFWDSADSATGAAWCSIGVDGTVQATAGATARHELSFDDVVEKLAIKAKCVAIIPIGQCACFGGYPGCVSPVLKEGQTGAMGTEAFLKFRGAHAAAAKVIAVPGCPTNPWWFILTVVAWLVDFTNGPGALPAKDGPLGILTSGNAIKATAVDSQRRLKAVYGTPLHGPFCTRYQDFLNGVFAAQSGDPGCLQLIGCKGPQTMTLCGSHGWNGQQPTNPDSWDHGIGEVNGNKGGNCVAGGAPCMGCTEAGYPDAFLPFIAR